LKPPFASNDNRRDLPPSLGGRIVQIPIRIRRHFHYFMVGVYLFVAGILSLGVAIDVISGKPTWDDLWVSLFLFGGLGAAQEALGWARSLKAEDDSDIRG
jgi:hypothetical protein